MPRASKSKTGAAPASKPRTGAIEFDPRPDLSLLEAYEQKNVRLWREAADNPTVIPNYSFKDERAWAEMNGAPEPGDPSRRGGETIELDGVSPTVLCGSDGSYGGVVIPGFLTGDALAHFTHATERVMEMELPPKLRSKPLAARAHFIRRSQASKALQRRISDLTASAQLRESGVIDGRLGTATSVPEFPTGPEPLASPPQNALPTPNPCPAPAARTVWRSARVRQSKTIRTPRQSPPTTILRPRPTPKNLA
ncbi:hypothetical protein FRC12_013585 [Ceratobasidium sp. 428]|nr:hypothetical protein FRC12_013585 [Ceratobasidium sp. 428]